MPIKKMPAINAVLSPFYTSALFSKIYGTWIVAWLQRTSIAEQPQHDGLCFRPSFYWNGPVHLTSFRILVIETQMPRNIGAFVWRTISGIVNGSTGPKPCPQVARSDCDVLPSDVSCASARRGDDQNLSQA